MINALFFKKMICVFAVLPPLLLLNGCNKIPPDVEEALQIAGVNRAELEKAIEYYRTQGDKQKVNALYYLIKHLPEQYHYTGELVVVFDSAFNKMNSIISTGKPVDYTTTWDSLQPGQKYKIKMIRDIQVITAEYLIENVERSFQAWHYPWARDLSFEDFCKYILPYKLKNEKPENWKAYFQKKYSWVIDSLKSGASYFDACVLINKEMARWFYITKLNCRFDLSFSQINKIKSGRCAESTQMAAYAMRSMGIPVVLEQVPSWANRNSGHDWNGLIVKDKTIAFLGTEIDPGIYKIEFPMPGSLRSKRAKIFRRTYERQKTSLVSQIRSTDVPPFFRDSKFQDVTGEYVPVATTNVQIDSAYLNFKIAYLCIFNNLNWTPIFYGKIRSGEAQFNNMGKGILYLPAVYYKGDMLPVGLPFILEEDGSISKIIPNKKNTVDISIPKKYPVKDDNEIQLGEKYELFYWDNGWESLGVKVSTGTTIRYSNVPEGALLLIHKIDKGIEERIFTYENGKQIWW